MTTVGLLTAAAALASVAHFRYEHNEPLNDLRVTPGATFQVTVAAICRSGYAGSVRDVPESEKKKVYAEYGIAHHTTNQYEVDHLISLELGGSNAIGNLWPELNDHPKGHLNSKDILEDHLHDLVCARALDLSTAQHLIATDWVAAYHRILGTWPKGGATPTTLTTTSAPSATATTKPTPITSPASTTSEGGEVTITSLSNPVADGSVATLAVHSSKSGDICTLTVTLPSGRTSTSPGLGTATANAGGDVSWTWKIESNTDPGTAQASISCSVGRAASSFTIT